MTKNATIAILFWSLSAPIALLGASSTNLFASIAALYPGALLYWSVVDREFWPRSVTTLRRVWSVRPFTVAVFTIGSAAYYLSSYYSIYRYASTQAIIISYLWLPLRGQAVPKQTS